jgi:hypothetical protein
MSTNANIWDIVSIHPQDIVGGKGKITNYATTKDRIMPDLNAGFRIYESDRGYAPPPSFFSNVGFQRMEAVHNSVGAEHFSFMQDKYPYDVAGGGVVGLPGVHKIRVNADGLPVQPLTDDNGARNFSVSKGIVDMWPFLSPSSGSAAPGQGGIAPPAPTAGGAAPAAGGAAPAGGGAAPAGGGGAAPAGGGGGDGGGGAMEVDEPYVFPFGWFMEADEEEVFGNEANPVEEEVKEPPAPRLGWGLTGRPEMMSAEDYQRQAGGLTRKQVMASVLHDLNQSLPTLTEEEKQRIQAAPDDPWASELEHQMHLAAILDVGAMYAGVPHQEARAVTISPAKLRALEEILAAKDPRWAELRHEVQLGMPNVEDMRRLAVDIESRMMMLTMRAYLASIGVTNPNMDRQALIRMENYMLQDFDANYGWYSAAMREAMGVGAPANVDVAANVGAPANVQPNVQENVVAADVAAAAPENVEPQQAVEQVGAAAAADPNDPVPGYNEMVAVAAVEQQVVNDANVVGALLVANEPVVEQAQAAQVVANMQGNVQQADNIAQAVRPMITLVEYEERFLAILRRQRAIITNKRGATEKLKSIDRQLTVVRARQQEYIKEYDALKGDRSIIDPGSADKPSTGLALVDMIGNRLFHQGAYIKELMNLKKVMEDNIRIAEEDEAEEQKEAMAAASSASKGLVIDLTPANLKSSAIPKDRVVVSALGAQASQRKQRRNSSVTDYGEKMQTKMAEERIKVVTDPQTGDWSIDWGTQPEDSPPKKKSVAETQQEKDYMARLKNFRQTSQPFSEVAAASAKAYDEGVMSRKQTRQREQAQPLHFAVELQGMTKFYDPAEVVTGIAAGAAVRQTNPPPVIYDANDLNNRAAAFRNSLKQHYIDASFITDDIWEAMNFATDVQSSGMTVQDIATLQQLSASRTAYVQAEQQLHVLDRQLEGVTMSQLQHEVDEAEFEANRARTYAQAAVDIMMQEIEKAKFTNLTPGLSMISDMQTKSANAKEAQKVSDAATIKARELTRKAEDVRKKAQATELLLNQKKIHAGMMSNVAVQPEARPEAITSRTNQAAFGAIQDSYRSTLEDVQGNAELERQVHEAHTQALTRLNQFAQYREGGSITEAEMVLVTNIPIAAQMNVTAPDINRKKMNPMNGSFEEPVRSNPLHGPIRSNPLNFSKTPTARSNPTRSTPLNFGLTPSARSDPLNGPVGNPLNMPISQRTFPETARSNPISQFTSQLSTRMPYHIVTNMPAAEEKTVREGSAPAGKITYETARGMDLASEDIRAYQSGAYSPRSEAATSVSSATSQYKMSVRPGGAPAGPASIASTTYPESIAGSGPAMMQAKNPNPGLDPNAGKNPFSDPAKKDVEDIFAVPEVENNPFNARVPEPEKQSGPAIRHSSSLSFGQ